MVVKPGDRVPITGLDWRIVTSAGQVLKTPLPGGGKPNPAVRGVHAEGNEQRPDDNGQSVGSVVTFGQFRAIDLGDLLWNKEQRADVPEQSDRHRRRVSRDASRARSVGLSGARPRAPAARGRHAERHAQGRRHAGDADDAVVAGARGHLAAALVVCEPASSRTARACSSRTWRTTATIAGILTAPAAAAVPVVARAAACAGGPPAAAPAAGASAAPAAGPRRRTPAAGSAALAGSRVRHRRRQPGHSGRRTRQRSGGAHARLLDQDICAA